MHNEFQLAIYLRQLSLQLRMLFTRSDSLLPFETYCSKEELDSHRREVCMSSGCRLCTHIRIGEQCTGKLFFTIVLCT